MGDEQSIWSKIKSHLIALCIGIVIGGAGIGTAVYFIMRPADIGEGKGIETEVVKSKKGSTLEHSDWNVKGKKISFTTEAHGDITTKTYIDKLLIPEVARWKNFNHGLQFNYYGLYYNELYHSWVGLSYYHRWGFFALGGGFLVEPERFKNPIKGNLPVAFTVGLQFWFKGL